MISVHTETLSPDKIRKIRDWLDREERAWLEQSVNAVIANYQATATNRALEKPHQTIEAHAVPDAAVLDLLEASRLQVFLNILQEVSNKEFQFITTKLSV